MEIDELTLHWLAGLLEGEGTFTAGVPSYPHKPIVALHMTDEDVVAQVAVLFGVKYHNDRSDQRRNKLWRPSFRVRVTGKRAVEWMTVLRPLMGQRRQTQIDRALAGYSGDNRRKLTPEPIEAIRQRCQNGESLIPLAKEFGVSKSLIHYIKLGHRYKT